MRTNPGASDSTVQRGTGHLVQHPRTGVLGVVSFLNARPLVDHLNDRPDCTVRPDVPSRLGAMLTEGHCDVALLPIVDAFRAGDRLQRISNACIASDGETLTVRVFSRVPPDRVTRLHADTHSHTSIVLAQVVWRELYGRKLELTPHEADPGCAFGDGVQAVLLIGDKVICDAPRGFGFEVDLGAAWKHLTDLPFVFAAWFAPADRELSDLAAQLEAARDDGVRDAERIARHYAPRHGWPEPIAVKYLRDIMRYTLTPPMLKAVERFQSLAERDGLI